eukprot:UN20826
MKMNSNIFAYFTSSICSLRRHFCRFYLEYLLITSVFLHILPRISAHFIHKILNSRNSEWETRVLRHPSGRKYVYKTSLIMHTSRSHNNIFRRFWKSWILKT